MRNTLVPTLPSQLEQASDRLSKVESCSSNLMGPSNLAIKAAPGRWELTGERGASGMNGRPKHTQALPGSSASRLGAPTTRAVRSREHEHSLVLVLRYAVSCFFTVDMIYTTLPGINLRVESISFDAVNRKLILFHAVRTRCESYRRSLLQKCHWRPSSHVPCVKLPTVSAFSKLPSLPTSHSPASNLQTRLCSRASLRAAFPTAVHSGEANISFDLRLCLTLLLLSGLQPIISQ